MSYKEVLNENRRLNILLTLQESPNYKANESILQVVLEKYGHSMTRAQIRTQLHWLAEQDLVELETIGSTLVVTLTVRGIDVALGRATAPGIKRPEPKV